MSTYTGRRRGFDLPRQEQSGLSVFSVPAVNQPPSNTADQVSRVLASLGQAASNLAAYNRQEQRALDLSMAGVADDAMSTMLPRLSSAIANDPNLPDDDAGIESYVRQIADKETAGLGLEPSPTVLNGLRSRIAGQLASQAFQLRDKRAELAVVGRLDDLGAGLPTAAETPGGIEEVVAAMRATSPNVTERTIQGYLQNAADSLAISGNAADKGRLDNLLSGITDPAQKASIQGKYLNNVTAAKNAADRAYQSQVNEGFELTLRDRPHMATAYLEGVKDTIPSGTYNAYKSRVDAAIAADWAKTQKDAYDTVVNTIVEQGADAAEIVFQQYLDNGVLEPKTKPGLASMASQRYNAQKQAEIETIGSDLMNGAITPQEAFGKLNAIGGELEDRVERSIEDPYSFSSTDAGMVRPLMADIQKMISVSADEAVKLNAINDGIRRTEAGGVWVPQDIPLSKGVQTAAEQRDAIVAMKWESIQQRTQDPQERTKLLTKELALLPGAESPVIKSQVSGILSLAHSVATEDDADRRQTALTDLERAVSFYRTVASYNDEVALRHIAASDREAAGYILLAMESSPNPVQAIRVALSSTRAPEQFSDTLNAEGMKKLVAKTIKDAGLSSAATDLQLSNIVRNKIAMYSVGLGMAPEDVASKVSKDLYSIYQVRNGRLLRTGDAASGKYIDPGVLENILMQTVPPSLRSGLSIGQIGNTGAWALIDEGGIPATEGITGDRAMQLVQLAQDTASEFSGTRSTIAGSAVSMSRHPLNTLAAETDSFSGFIQSLVDKTVSKVAKGEIDKYLQREAGYRIEREQDELNKAALTVARSIADLEPAAKTQPSRSLDLGGSRFRP